MKTDIVELELSENAKLMVHVTEEMRKDLRECHVNVCTAGAEPKNCGQCSMNAGTEGTALCEIEALTEYMRQTDDVQIMDCTGCIHKGNKQFCLNCRRWGVHDYYLTEDDNEHNGALQREAEKV